MSEIETDSQSKVVVSFRRRLILAGFLFFVALFLWLQTPEPRAANYIRVYGYFFTAAAFLGFAASVMPLIAGFVTRTISRREWLLAASVVALGAWLIFSHAAFDYKFVQSEYRNAAVAESLHVERTVEVLSGGRLIGDRFIRIYRESTTQAWMYPFLVSLTHDVLGYRESNLFIVNACLGIALLALGYAQGACLGGRQGGILALLLWVSLPLLSYSASGAGIELSQVVLLQAVISFIFFVFKGAECWQRDAAMSWDGVTRVLPSGSTVFCDSGCLCDCCRMDQNQALFILLGSGLLCALASWGAVVTDCSA